MNKRIIFRALSWNFIGTYANQAVLFVIGIILARLLEPKDFGVVAIVSVFAAYGEIFINLGFSNAIIQDKSPSQKDLSTVFFFNVGAGLIFFVVFFSCSGLVASFYDEQQLVVITRLMALLSIFYALASVQRTLLVKKLDFKTETSVILVASLISGSISIFLAVKGYGVWALVLKVLLQRFLEMSFFWLKNTWRPSLLFNPGTIKKYFNFSLNMTGATLLDGFTQDIDKLIVGKVFSSQILGFFDRARRYNDIARKNLGKMMGKVMFPVFSEIQDNEKKFLGIYRKTVQMICFFSVPFFFIIASVAESLIVVLITGKWLGAARLLQVMALSGFAYPISVVMVQTLAAKGRADILLKLNIVATILYVSGILVGSRWGIFSVAIAIAIVHFICLVINSIVVCRLIKFSFLTQVKDVLRMLIIALVMLVVIVLIPHFVSLDHVLTLIVLPLSGILVYLLLNYLFNRSQLFEFKNFFLEVLRPAKSKK